MAIYKPPAVDALGDNLAAGHLLADAVVGDNEGVTQVSRLKFPKGVSNDIKKLVKFYKFERFKTRVTPAYRAMKEAYDLYTSYADRSAPKWIAEALLLGGVEYSEISERCGISEEAVALYRKFYFDVSREENVRQLRVRCAGKADYADDVELSNWGFKLEVMLNGSEWFIRTRLDMCPTAKDRKILRKMIRDRYDTISAEISLMARNRKNFRDPSFLAQAETVGATMSHIQKDEDRELRQKQGSSDPGAADELLKKIGAIYVEERINPADTRESSFDEEKPAEEALPI